MKKDFFVNLAEQPLTLKTRRLGQNVAFEWTQFLTVVGLWPQKAVRTFSLSPPPKINLQVQNGRSTASPVGRAKLFGHLCRNPIFLRNIHTNGVAGKPSNINPPLPDHQNRTATLTLRRWCTGHLLDRGALLQDIRHFPGFVTVDPRAPFCSKGVNVPLAL